MISDLVYTSDIFDLVLIKLSWANCWVSIYDLEYVSDISALVDPNYKRFVLIWVLVSFYFKT